MSAAESEPVSSETDEPLTEYQQALVKSEITRLWDSVTYDLFSGFDLLLDRNPSLTEEALRGFVKKRLGSEIVEEYDEWREG